MQADRSIATACFVGQTDLLKTQLERPNSVSMAIGMRISVVIPIHNRQALGERALRSAVAQGIDGMEVVVVDDYSQTPFGLPPDITGRADVRVIRHSENRGAAAARNTGVEAARGGWVAFLDSDDYWLADTL